MEKLPPSFAQQRLWFLNRMDPDNSVYNLPIAWEIIGDLDVAALECALNEIVRRHEVLRTTFDLEGEELVQVVHQHLPPAFEIAEAGQHADSRAQAELACVRHAQRRFDLMQESLLRALLIRLGDDTHFFQLTLHHIISDGWSAGVLTRELIALYTAFSKGQPSPLPELPIQYADYAIWQRDWLQGDLLEKQLAYWKKTLEQAPPLLELPLDRNRPAKISHRGGAVNIEFDARSVARLHQLCREEQVTLFMAVATVFTAVLHRYSGHSDICFGYPVAGRARKELEGLIGFFVNTLVLRTRPRPDQSFAGLLQQVRDAVLDGDAHQDLPFDTLIEALNPERSLSYSPLFQVMLTLNVEDSGKHSLPGLQWLPLGPHSSSDAKFDLTLDLTDADGRLFGAIAYNTDIFDQTTIVRLVGHLQTLLAAALERPATPIADLPLLTPAERAQIDGWSQAHGDLPTDKCVHELFEAQVARTPDAVAVLFADQSLRFGELNAAANRLAHYLRAHRQVTAGTRVGICMDRSPQMIVAMLGVMKAGGAYVPLDPSYPPERLGYMLHDGGLDTTITSTRLCAAMPFGAARALCLDAPEVRAQLAHEPVTNIGVDTLGIASGHLAYVIYTSGSTGLPKGVMVEHRSVVNLWQALAATAYATGEAPMTVALNAAISFDSSVKGIVQLLSGHSIDIVPQHLRTDGAALLRWLKERRIDTFDCTPSQLELLCHAGLLDDPAMREKRIVIGGEAIQAHWWQQLQAAGIRAYNVYGPTECTVDATVAAIHESAGIPHIGRPLPNVRVHILDQRRQPLPVGIAGELYIGGAGVARGYLNRPEMTDERFVADPFSAAPGARMYKSGDLGRWMADGNIDYLGRNDFQVKIRGYRIELSEIEARLMQVEGVKETAVIAREDSSGDKQLVAYLTLMDGVALGVADLRARLSCSLPEFMVPSAYVTLACFPLTPNGKLDRQALPAPNRAETRLKAEYAAPRTAAEQALSTVWADLLKVERVGIHDNFFELGGHSLLAVRMVARLEHRFSLQDVFRAPTVAQLGAILEAGPECGASLILPIEATGPYSGRPSPGQQDLLPIFFNPDVPADELLTIRSAWSLEGPLSVEHLQAAVNQVVSRHDALRMHFRNSPGGFVAAIDEHARVAIAVEELQAIAHEPESVRRRVLDTLYKPLDLSCAPLLRLTLYKLGKERHILGMAVSHLVFDGESGAIFWDEATRAYEALGAGEPAAPGPLPVQYSVFSDWQRRFMETDPLAQSQCAYWRQRLAGMASTLPLPCDLPRPSRFMHAGAMVSCKLDPSVAAALREQGKLQGWTRNTQGIAALFAMLSVESGERDVFLYNPAAGRLAPELFGSIGFYARALIIRGQVEPTDSCADLMAQLHEHCLEALSNHHVPRSAIAAQIAGPAPDASYGARFQVSFSHVSVDDSRIRLGAIPMEPYPCGSSGTHYDLRVMLVESATGLELSIQYCRALFTAGSARRMLDGMVNALAFLSAQPLPDQPVSRLLARVRVRDMALRDVHAA